MAATAATSTTTAPRSPTRWANGRRAPPRGGVTIALTLLRCVGWLARFDFPSRKGPAGPILATPGAQCPGRHVFDYAIIPHAGGWQRSYAEAHRFAAPRRARWTPHGSGLLPAEASLLELEGDGLAVTALKRAEDGGA